MRAICEQKYVIPISCLFEVTIYVYIIYTSCPNLNFHKK